VYPEAQLQVISPELLLQVPPFWQGLGKQGSSGAGSVKIERNVSTQVKWTFLIKHSGILKPRL